MVSIPHPQRPRKRPDPVSLPKAQEVSRLWTHDEGMDRKNLDLSHKQADKLQGRCLAKWQPRLSPRMRAPHRCTLVLSAGGRSEQSGGCVWFTVSIWQDVSN